MQPNILFCEWGSSGLNPGAFIGCNIYKLLLLSMNSLLEPIIFADGTSVLIFNRNFKDFCTLWNLVLSHIIEWLGPKSRWNRYNEIYIE